MHMGEFERMRVILQSSRTDIKTHADILEKLIDIAEAQEKRVRKLESKPELKVENLPYHKTSKTALA